MGSGIGKEDATPHRGGSGAGDVNNAAVSALSSVQQVPPRSPRPAASAPQGNTQGDRDPKPGAPPLPPSAEANNTHNNNSASNYVPLHSSQLQTPKAQNLPKSPRTAGQPLNPQALLSPGSPPKRGDGGDVEESMNTLPPSSAAFLAKYDGQRQTHTAEGDVHHGSAGGGGGGISTTATAAVPARKRGSIPKANAKNTTKNLAPPPPLSSATVHGAGEGRGRRNNSITTATASATNSASRSSPSPSPTVDSQHDHQLDTTAQQQKEDQQQTSGAPLPMTARVPGPQRYYYSHYRPPCRSVSPAPTLSREYSRLQLADVQDALRARHRILKIVLTGGPCAGKSTLLERIMEEVPKRTDFRVFTVPEAATLFIGCGMTWDPNLVVYQQHLLLEMQLRLEDTVYKLAEGCGQNCLLVCDRGAMDGRAFCSPEQFDQVLELLSDEQQQQQQQQHTVGGGGGADGASEAGDPRITVEVLRDRYDGVLHMVTAAIGAEEFYNNDNVARYEDVEGARASDLKLRKTYVGHSCFRLLENTPGESFADKIERGIQTVLSMMGLPASAAAASNPYSSAYFLLQPQPQQLQASVAQSSSVSAPGDAAPLTVPTAAFIPDDVTTARYRIFITILSNSDLHEVRLVMRKQMATDGSCVYFFKSMRNHMATPGGANMGDARGDAAEASILSACQRAASSVNSAGTPPQQQQQQQRIDTQQRISSKEYRSLLQYRDAQREEVVLEAVQFMQGSCIYEYNCFVAPAWAAGKETLRVEYPQCPPTPSRGSVGGAASSNEAGKAAPSTADNAMNTTADSLLSDVAAGVQAPDPMVEIPDFLKVDREVPMDRELTAFLVSHRETGALYTSLAFAPVFSSSRFHTAGGAGRLVQARGAHADVQDILCSTRSSSPLKVPGSGMLGRRRASASASVLLAATNDAAGGVAAAAADTPETEQRADGSEDAQEEVGEAKQPSAQLAPSAARRLDTDDATATSDAEVEGEDAAAVEESNISAQQPEAPFFTKGRGHNTAPPTEVDAGAGGSAETLLAGPTTPDRPRAPMAHVRPDANPETIHDEGNEEASDAHSEAEAVAEPEVFANPKTPPRPATHNSNDGEEEEGDAAHPEEQPQPWRPNPRSLGAFGQSQQQYQQQGEESLVEESVEATPVAPGAAGSPLTGESARSSGGGGDRDDNSTPAKKAHRHRKTGGSPQSSAKKTKRVTASPKPRGLQNHSNVNVLSGRPLKDAGATTMGGGVFDTVEDDNTEKDATPQIPRLRETRRDPFAGSLPPIDGAATATATTDKLSYFASQELHETVNMSAISEVDVA